MRNRPLVRDERWVIVILKEYFQHFVLFQGGYFSPKSVCTTWYWESKSKIFWKKTDLISIKSVCTCTILKHEKKYIENILEEGSLTFQRKCSHNWLSISCSSCRASTPYMGNRDSITNSQTPYMGSKDLLAAAYMNSLFVKILLILCTCIYGQQRHAHASLHGLIVCLTNIWILCTWSIKSLTAKTPYL